MTQLTTIAYTLLVVIVSIFWLERVDAQTKEKNTSWKVIEALHILSNAVASLEAKIEGQAAFMNNSVASLEAKIERQAALLNKFVSKEEWQEPVPLYTTTQTILALQDQDVDIWCVVHGTPLPEIKWTKENGTLAYDRVEFGNNGRVLRIKHVQLKDQGTYVCVAANGVGTPVSQSVSLEVNAPSAGAATGLFAATSTGLVSLDLRTLEATALTSESTVAVAVNNKLKKVYWTEYPKGIMRSNFDGSSEEIIFPETNDFIYILTIDEPSGNLYFTRFSSNEITVCSALGENCAAVVSDSRLVNNTGSIAVDSANGVLYWGSERSPVALARFNLNGSNVAVISREFKGIYGIVLDPRLNGVLYWADIDNKTIGTIDVNGGNQRTLVKLEGNSGPWGIQVDSQKIYIGNYWGRTIQTADRDSGKELTTIFNSPGSVRQLAFFDAPA